MLVPVLQNAIAEVRIDGVVDPFLTPHGNIAGQFLSNYQFYDFEINEDIVRYHKSYRKDSKGKKCPGGYWIPREYKCRQGMMTPSAKGKINGIKGALAVALTAGVVAGGVAIAKSKLSQGNAMPFQKESESKLKKLMSDRRVQVGGAIALSGGAFALGKKYFDDQEKLPEEWKDFVDKSDELEDFLKQKREKTQPKNERTNTKTAKANPNAIGTRVSPNKGVEVKPGSTSSIPPSTPQKALPGGREEQQNSSTGAIVPTKPITKDKWGVRALETIGDIDRKDLTPEENEKASKLMDEQFELLNELMGGNFLEGHETLAELRETQEKQARESEVRQKEVQQRKQSQLDTELSRRGKAEYKPYTPKEKYAKEVDNYLREQKIEVTATEDEIDNELRKYIMSPVNDDVTGFTREEVRNRIISDKRFQIFGRIANQRLKDETNLEELDRQMEEDIKKRRKKQ